MERVSILSFTELYGPLHKYQSQKPTGLASLVLHEGLLEAKIPPHHRLSLHQLLPWYSLMQSCIDVILQSILLVKNVTTRKKMSKTSLDICRFTCRKQYVNFSQIQTRSYMLQSYREACK